MSEGVKVEGRNRTLILANILITTIAASLLMSALNTSLARVCDDIGINVTTGQWLISGEMLAMGIVMPLTAFMMRRFRTKRLYLTSIIIFIAGLVLAMVSPNFLVMMVGRVMQGCGNGMIMTMGQVIILSIYPSEKQGGAMGIYGLAIAVSPMIAPTMGGVLTDTAGWRSIFFVVMIIMVFSLIMAICVFKNVLDTENFKLDLSSFTLSVLAFGGLTLGIGLLSNNGRSPAVWICLAVGAVCMVIFVRRQLNLQNPFLDMKILKVRKYTIAVISSMLINLIMYGAAVVMPLFIQNIVGRSATIAGLVFLPGSIIMGVISPFAGRFYDKHGIKGMFVTGAAIFTLNFVCLTTISVNTSLIIVSIFNIMRFAGAGIMQMQLITWGTTQVEPSRISDASALLQSLRTITASVGSALFVGIMSTVSANSADSYGEMAEMHGVTTAFIWMVIISFAILFISIFLVRKKTPVSEN